MGKPLAIDLFCGAGGASMGLHRAGFDVVGVDIDPQPHYPFRFVQADALSPPFDLTIFDFVWASPPCQAYTVGNAGNKLAKSKHPRLIEPVRAMLQNCAYWVIENVPGAPLRVDLALDGTMFSDLRVIRRRHFEMTFTPPFALGFDATGYVQNKGWASPRRGGSISRKGEAAAARLGLPSPNRASNCRAAMGVDWMNRDELGEAIPPAYSEFIGRAALHAMGDL